MIIWQGVGAERNAKIDPRGIKVKLKYSQKVSTSNPERIPKVSKREPKRSEKGAKRYPKGHPALPKESLRTGTDFDTEKGTVRDTICFRISET